MRFTGILKTSMKGKLVWTTEHDDSKCMKAKTQALALAIPGEAVETF